MHTDCILIAGRTGWDVLSPRGTFAPLGRLRSLPRDAHEEEYLRLRAMGHVFRIKPNRSVGAWFNVLLKPINNSYADARGVAHGDFRWARVVKRISYAGEWTGKGQ